MFRRVPKDNTLSFTAFPSILAVILLAVSFLFMVFRLNPLVEDLRSFLYYWVSPGQATLFAAKTRISGLNQRLRDFVFLDQENRATKEKIKELSQIEFKYQESLAEISRLNRLLELKSSLPYKTLAAKILSKEGRNWNQTLMIDKGRKDGVKVGAVVLGLENSPQDAASFISGVIGRVVRVGPNNAQVLLLTDPQSHAAAKIARTQEEGLLDGHSHALALEYLDPNSDAQIGDQVLTSGIGPVFPEGLGLGKITEISVTRSGFKKAQVQSFVSLSKIKEVLLLTK